MGDYILEMKEIVKEFPGVKALQNAQLLVAPGTVHALMGENGAGKSTLMKCLLGIYRKTSGSIIFDGQEVSYKNPLEALNSGISMIHQELMPVPERTVAQNVWVAREPRRGIKINHNKMRQDTLSLFEEMEFTIDPDERMGNLTVAQMQMVEICKAFSYRPKIMILDEPTSSLTETEVEHLFKIIGRLKAQGCAMIYITHKMDEVFRICDEVTVLRDGEYVSHTYTKDSTVDILITDMVGREVKEMFPKMECPIGEVILEVKGLASGKEVKEVSFDLRKGEILGFAGLVGAGRTETVETIFGMRHKDSGEIIKSGEPLNIQSPEDAIRNKIVLLTEDRRKNGIVGVRDITANTILANLKAYGLPMNHKKIRKDTTEYVDKLNVRTPSNNQQIMYLSGGNQQKVLVARWLLTQPDILIVDEPTRGIDVGAKAEIHTLLSTLACEGKSIIMISSELPEVMGMSDRIVTMHEGRVTGIVEHGEWTSEHIMTLCYGEIASQNQ